MGQSLGHPACRWESGNWDSNGDSEGRASAHAWQGEEERCLHPWGHRGISPQAGVIPAPGLLSRVLLAASWQQLACLLMVFLKDFALILFSARRFCTSAAGENKIP